MQGRCDTASINQEVTILFWKVMLCGAVLCVRKASSLKSLVCLLFNEEQMLFISFLCLTPPRFKSFYKILYLGQKPSPAKVALHCQTAMWEFVRGVFCSCACVVPHFLGPALSPAGVRRAERSS